jgi:hypothetical protein
VQINVSHNIGEVLGFVNRLHKQAPFAIAKALTDTVRDVQAVMPAEVNKTSEGGAVEFTKRGFFTTPARKGSLSATVGAKDKQAQYLRFQIEGGRRQPARQALRLPSVVQLTEQGNLPAGLIRQLVARAKAGKRATRTQSRRFGVSQALDLFYGEPGDGRPAGIYKRVVLSATRHQLIPIIVFPKQDAAYTKRPFDFYGIAKRVALQRFDANLDRAWRLALATAR